jgi:hypothetical protein
MSEPALALPKDEACPYCETPLEEWEPTAYHGFPNNLFFCPNDQCAYFRGGRQAIAEQFKRNFGYRYCYDPGSNSAFPLVAWCGGGRSYLKGRCEA